MSTCPAINVMGFSKKVSSRSMRFPAKKKMVSRPKCSSFQEKEIQQSSKIIGRILHDEVSLEVKSDALTCEYGDRLLEKHENDPSKDGFVSQKMRELGRFVIAAKNKALNKTVKKLEDLLVPPMFKLAGDAAKKACGYTKSKYRYERPSLKTVGDIMIGHM